jgi:hypothetical protein
MENNKKYSIYIDESGIISKIGHSVYVLVYIEYANEFSINEHILKIERDLKIYHIHWVILSKKVRIKVAKKLKEINFYYICQVYKNPIGQEKALENLLVQLIKFDGTVFKIAVDGEGVDRYEKYLKKILRDRGIKIYKLKFVNDKKEPIVRVADFIAGLIRSRLDKSGKDSEDMYQLLKGKEKIPD